MTHVSWREGLARDPPAYAVGVFADLTKERRSRAKAAAAGAAFKAEAADLQAENDAWLAAEAQRCRAQKNPIGAPCGG